MYNLVAGMTTTFAQVRDWEGLQRYREKKKKKSMQWHPGWADLLIHGTIKKRKLGVPCGYEETFENLRSNSSKIFSKY